jgi:hypothetical protein
MNKLHSSLLIAKVSSDRFLDNFLHQDVNETIKDTWGLKELLKSFALFYRMITNEVKQIQCKVLIDGNE